MDSPITVDEELLSSLTTLLTLSLRLEHALDTCERVQILASKNKAEYGSVYRTMERVAADLTHARAEVRTKIASTWVSRKPGTVGSDIIGALAQRMPG